MPDNFRGYEERYYRFELEEFKFVGLSMPRGYLDAADRITFGDIGSARIVLDHENQYAGFDLRYDPETKKEIDDRVREAKRLLHENSATIDMFNQANEQFEIVLERAWAKIFSLIQADGLTVEAVNLERWERLYEADDAQQAGEFERLPPKAFRLGHDYRTNEVFFQNSEYVLTRVNTNELLGLVKQSIPTSPSVSTRSFGRNLAVDGPSVARRKRRGAPHIVDWGPAKERLDIMVSTGSLPEKKEACIQELIEFVRSYSGKTVGRTTVQNQLAIELAGAYARNS